MQHDHKKVVPGCYRCELNEDEYRSNLETQVEEYDYLLEQLSSPPPGWYVLGTHIDRETGKALDVELEFWGDDGGVPFWERPKVNSSRCMSCGHYRRQHDQDTMIAECRLCACSEYRKRQT